MYILDLTTNSFNHHNVKGEAIGASEYQLYRLIPFLALKTPVTVFHKRAGENYQLDSIHYKTWHSLQMEVLDTTRPFLCQRFLPPLYGSLFEKMRKHCRIYLWCHDLCNQRENYIRFEQQDDFRYPAVFEQKILEKLLSVYNLHWIFNSFSSQGLFLDFLGPRYSPPASRIHVIYNALYEDDFSCTEKEEINPYQITFASSWAKGLGAVLDWFEYACRHDDKLELHLLSPTYSWDKDILPSIQQRFRHRVVIHGPLRKKEYSSMIRRSLCVLTAPYFETFGCVFAESYYLGTPVIADPSSGAVKEIVRHEDVISLKDHDAYLQKVREFQGNKKPKISLREEFLSHSVHRKWMELLQLDIGT